MYYVSYLYVSVMALLTVVSSVAHGREQYCSQVLAVLLTAVSNIYHGCEQQQQTMTKIASS